jgi:two-component sensor histidine kinase
MTADQTSALKWQPEHLQLAITAAGVALWSWNVTDDTFTMDEQGHNL